MARQLIFFNRPLCVCLRRSGDPNSGYPTSPEWEALDIESAMGILLDEGAFGTSPELQKHIGGFVCSVSVLCLGFVDVSSAQHEDKLRGNQSCNQSPWRPCALLQALCCRHGACTSR